MGYTILEGYWDSDISTEEEEEEEEEVEDITDENMFVVNGIVLLLGVKYDITVEDLLNYFNGVDYGWAMIKSDPDTGWPCGYAMIQTFRHSFINKKHKIKSSYVTALPTTPPPIIEMMLSKDQGEIPEDKGKTFSTERTLRPGPRTIYVGGFSPFLQYVDAYTIGNYFSQYGIVEAVDLPHVILRGPPSSKTPPGPLSCGYALVLFALNDSVADVLAKSSHCIRGDPVVVYPTDDARLDYPLLLQPNETEHISKKPKLEEA